ncbi:MAG TPA: hypothetical protein VNO50_16685 [Pyrinomonadaceae bacterium]|nr:hypothetical protein [Pyrinomonadaceae bacterium]
MPDKTKQQRLRSALPLILAVVPPIFTGLSIYIFAVDTPLWDEWLIGGYLHEFSQGTLSFRDLFAQQNEYRQFFPNLIFVGLGWLTSWDVRSWMAASFVAAAVVSFCIYRLGKWSLPETPLRAPWTWFIANLIIFSPVQHENWLQGQQLVYFLPIACFTASLLITSTGQLRTGTRFLLCAALSIIASFSSVNGMLCWILLLPLLAWSTSSSEFWRKKWWVIFWIAGFAATLALYFKGYRRPVQNDPFALIRTNPADTLAYYLGTLGRSLAPGRTFIAVSVGLVLILLFVWTGARFVKALRGSSPHARRSLTWLTLGAYSVLTTGLLTIGRLDHDASRALAPTRYTTYTIFLPVALVYLVAMNGGNDFRQLRLLSVRISARVVAFAAVTLVIIHLAIYAMGIRQMSSFRTAALYSKGCSLFVNVLDDECLTEQVFPDLDVLMRNINQTNRLGFIRPGLMKSNRVEEIADSQFSGRDSLGAFQGLAPAENGTYIASGWAKLPGRDEPADAVLLAFADGDSPPVIFAIAPVNRSRDLVSALIGRGNYGDARWSRSFGRERIASERAQLTAWAFDALSGKAYKLQGVHAFQNQSGSNQINGHEHSK